MNDPIPLEKKKEKKNDIKFYDFILNKLTSKSESWAPLILHYIVYKQKNERN